MNNIIKKDFLQNMMCYQLQEAPQNYKEITKLLESGEATEKLTNAEYNLGVIYHKGLGVPKKYEKAIELYQNAAKKGHAKAQNNLGVMFAKEQWVDMYSSGRDEYYYNKAAEQGEKIAQYNLGIMHYYRHFKNKEQVENKEQENVFQGDLIAAYMWVSLAIASGYNMARNVLEDIESQMLFRDVKNAQMQANGLWETYQEKWNQIRKTT